MISFAMSAMTLGAVYSGGPDWQKDNPYMPGMIDVHSQTMA